MKPKILCADSACDLYKETLIARFPQVEFSFCRSADELKAARRSGDFPVAYSCVSNLFKRAEHASIGSAQGLQWLHVGGSGFDHFAGIDRQNIAITNGRGVLAPFLADTIIGSLIALNHGFLQFSRNQHDKNFAPRTHPALQGQSLLVIGPGSIGQELARKAAVFGIRCHAISRSNKPIKGFDRVNGYDSLLDWLPLADLVSVNVPLDRSTVGLLGKPEFEAMKPTAILAHCARGGVVDEAAMTEALRRGAIKAAYIDVFETEPLPAESPLWHLPNAFLTPHCSDQVDDWQIRHANFFADNLERWLAGKPLQNLIATAV